MLISLPQNLVQHVGQDSARVVVIDFGWGIEADFERERDFGAVGLCGGEGGGLHGFEFAGDAGDVEGGVGEILDFVVVGFVDEVEWEDAHADEVGAVDALEGFGDDGFDAEEACAFGGPVAG